MRGSYPFFLGIREGFQKRRGNLEPVVGNQRNWPGKYRQEGGERWLVRGGGMEIHSRQSIQLMRKCGGIKQLMRKCGGIKQLSPFCDSESALLP